MFYLIFGIVLIISSFFIGRMGCMGVYVPVGCVIFILGLYLLLSYFGIVPTGLLF